MSKNMLNNKSYSFSIYFGYPKGQSKQYFYAHNGGMERS